MSRAGVRGLTAAVLAALLALCALRLELTHSIAHFLPTGRGVELAELSLRVADSALANRMVLSIGGGEGRFAAARGLADLLAARPEVAWVETGLDEEDQRALYELYFDRRLYLASDSPGEEVPRWLGSDALSARAVELRRHLAGPSSALLARTAAEDPLGLFPAILARARGSDSALRVEQGVFSTRDGEHAIVLLATRASPFDSSSQIPLLEAIDAEFSRLDGELGGDLVLERAGIHPIAVAAERSIRSDVDFISALSVVGVCALFLLVFRSFWQLLLAVLPAFVGFVAAVAVATSVSPPVHGVTLGFGLALIGVAIDYPIHVLNHHALSGGGDARETVVRIRASLLLSALTTAASFAVLGLSEFPGLADMGAFAAVGVVASLLVSLLALPAFVTGRGGGSGFQRAAAPYLASLLSRLASHPRLVVAIPLSFGVVAAVGLPRLAWQDDPGALSHTDPALVAEDAEVRRRILDIDAEQLVIARADDAEAALVLNDRVALRLGRAVEAGHLGGMRSVHDILWSEALQRENRAAFAAQPDLRRRIDAAFAGEGFRPGAFDAFADAVAAPQAQPLTPADLADSPLALALDASLVPLDPHWAAVTQLRDVRSEAGVREALTGLDDVHYVDQSQLLGEIYSGYRRSTVGLVALGSAVVLLILGLRYRRPRTALLAFLPSALVALTTLGVLGLFAVEVNVVVAISLVIVMGMGVDYGVFAVDAAADAERIGSTLLSLCVGCVTTIFVFGVLALSEQPALRSIGLTTGTGVLLALLLAPAVMILARPAARP